MKRFWQATNRAIALLLAATMAIQPLAAAKPNKVRAELEAQLRAHVTELASDAYEGREPGTEGEAKTLRYIGKQWFDIGLQSGTNDPAHPWFAPVNLIARDPDASRAYFTRKGKRLYLPAGMILVLTSGKRGLVENAPVLFVGKGEVVPARTELAGRVALLLDGGKDNSDRQNALIKQGASGVITVLDGERSLENVTARRMRTGYALATDKLGGDLEAFITPEALNGVMAGAGLDLTKLQAEAASSGFAPRPLDLAVSLEATTRETRIKTHNIIGKLPGKRPELGAVLLLAHWDHFGTCAETPAEDLICNGAVDNASGVAVLTEVARRLAKGPQLDRDVYFLATTGEEIGFLGVEAFADNPPLPLGNIVAAFNIDTVALAPAGSPFAIVGKGMTPLDPHIASVAKANKRKLAEGDAANAYVRRQDGWALMQHDVPAVMVSSSWSDIAVVEKFMDSDYHRPGDQVSRGIELGGAADDVEFLIALARWFGDPKKVPFARN
ncbi:MULTISPECIES: M28 family peptidase [unclassified Novosphingobium]|uniref:M28 family metallopeptidase n=1 Tax=unclassified Novosphingobium TaxID=2644732 RepID=UPI0025E64404|nr:MULTISPECIES: M28 family peptidase [unclassified Novosphingobium]HQV02996.1 M28 family peptidase [Novosphingobium sp.]